MTKLPILAIALAALFAGSAAAAPNVVASIKPVHSLVAAVMKGVGEPGLIVEGAGSPHTYALKPSQARMLQEARLVFWIGPEMEGFLQKPLSALAPDANAVELMASEGLTLLEAREGGTFDEHIHYDASGKVVPEPEPAAGEVETNAHVWLDPANAQIFVNRIAAALADADPEHAAAYNANAEAEKARLDALIGEIDAQLAPVRGRGFIVFHDAYPYFENRFAVAASGSVTINPEVSPGAGRIGEIRAKVKALGATCVFAEPQFEPKLVTVIVGGTGARTGVLDPLGAAIANGPDLYFELLRQLAKSMRDCLAPAS